MPRKLDLTKQKPIGKVDGRPLTVDRKPLTVNGSKDKSETWEDTHVRKTFYIRKTLLADLKKLAKSNDVSDSELINAGIKAVMAGKVKLDK